MSYRYDPELAELIPQIPVRDLADLESTRKAVAEAAAAFSVDTAGVDITEQVIPGDVTVRVYRPAGAPGGLTGAILHAHGGGFVMCDLESSHRRNTELTRELGVPLVSVDYRLAPEHPFPSALEDMRAAWIWADAQYDGPLGLGGDSAGGNLAAGLALHASTRPSFLVLLYPVLGAPGATASYHSQVGAFPIGAAEMEWFVAHYLRGVRPTAVVSDVFPLEADDLAQLPATHVVVAAHDPLHDDGALFAERLDAAGVPVTLVDHDDLCHGFLRFTAVSARARVARDTVVSAVVALANQSSITRSPASEVYR